MKLTNRFFSGIALFVVVAAFSSVAWAQNASVSITSMVVGETNVLESGSAPFTFDEGADVAISYEFEGEATGVVTKINGEVRDRIEPPDASGEIPMKALDPGAFFVEIVAYDEDGVEIASDGRAFSVSSKADKAKAEAEEQLGFFRTDNFVLIGLAVVALLFIYFTFLFYGRQKSANRELEDAYAELEEAQAGQKNHTAELEKLRKLNGSYEMQIEHLVLTVRELEKVNVELAKKKKLLEKNQSKLEELQSQKDEVLSGVVSDITNPADAIRELIALLESYDLNATEQRDVIESLMHSSSNLIKLAQRISTVVTKGAPKTNRADGPMKLAPASLKPIINDVVNNNIAYAERKNVELINNATVGMPETNIDKDAMAQVIDQLINNAVKFSPPETSVRVKSYFSPDKVVVEVTDNGVGIPEDELPRVFEKGVTLSPQPTGDEASAGVGLYEAKKIVDKHRGKIFVKSRQGVGTSFIVELPREGEE